MNIKCDTDRLNWMDEMRRECEGHVLSRCFLPGDQTLRENIDAMMKLNAGPIFTQSALADLREAEKIQLATHEITNPI